MVSCFFLRFRQYENLRNEKFRIEPIPFTIQEEPISVPKSPIPQVPIIQEKTLSVPKSEGSKFGLLLGWAGWVLLVLGYVVVVYNKNVGREVSTYPLPE